MALTHKPTLTKPTEGRIIAVSGDVYRFLLTHCAGHPVGSDAGVPLAVGEDIDGKYALWEAIVPSGRRATPAGPQSRRGRLLRARR